MSVNIHECFGYIIGLSRTECNCPEYADKPADYSESDSNIWLDELEGLNLRLLAANVKCEQMTLWDWMAWAREEAIKIMETDLLSCIMRNTRIKREPFDGIIGDYTRVTRTMQFGETYAGFRVRIADIVGGVVTLKKIGMFFASTGLKDVSIYTTQGELYATIANLPTLANKIKWTDLPTPIDLPTDSDTSPYTDYNFIYARDANMPKDMKVSCNCGGGFKPYWNAASPQYVVPQDRGNYKWANWAMARGVRGNDLADLEDWNGTTENNGIALGMSFDCESKLTICNGSLNYNNLFSMPMAYAVRFKAGELLAKKILADPEPNAYSESAPEVLSAFMGSWRAEYESRVNDFLCPVMSQPEYVNKFADCLACMSPHHFGKFAIAK